MRTIRNLLCTTLATAVLAGAATAQTVVEWTFNSVPADATPTTGTLSPSIGTGSIAAVGAITGVSPAVFQAGSATDTSSAGDNSGLQTTAYPAQGAGSGTSGVRFNASTVGANNINVSFEQRHSNTASRFFRFEYTTDGTNFVTTGLANAGVYSITVGSAFTAFNFDLSSVGAASNNANFGFRVLSIFDPASGTAYAATQTGSTYGTGGTVRFDLVRVVQGAPPIGACCVNGFCVGDQTESSCLANGAGSSWGGSGTTCTSFVCAQPTGACCVGIACSITSQVNCTGTWTLNQACTPTNPCDPAAACCFPGSCLIRNSADCATLAGTYQGVGSVCAPSPCPPPPSGACCTGAACATSPDPLTCLTGGGQFKGYGTTCTPNPCFVASGTIVSTYDFDANVVGTPAANLSFSATPSLPAGIFSNAFDVFGVIDRTVNVDFADDSLLGADTQGIFRSTETGKAFGVEDLLNPDNTAGTGTATWTFNIAGFSNLNVSIDFAAYGNFEQLGTGTGSVPDSYVIKASIDGGAPVTIFQSSIYEGLVPTYTFESGATDITTNDPAAINGGAVLNRFQTFAAPVAGTGSVLTLTFEASADGGSEIFALDNIVIRGTTAGGNGACCAGTTCSSTSATGCVGPFTSFKGVNTTCNAPGNNTQPCCKADYNQSGTVTVQDIFDFLGGYFTGDAKADINGGGTSVQDIFDFLAAYFTGCV